MPDLPTVAQVRRHLERHGWRASETYEYGTVWRGPEGWHAVIPDWADDDTRLLEHSTAIHVIAEASGYTLDQIGRVVADILVDDEDFADCWRCCRPGKPESEWKHTLKWGDCGKAVEPEPQPARLDIPCTWTADDGYLSAGWSSVPLTLFAPWAEHLPAVDQHAMLKEIADTKANARPGIVEAWQRTAEQLADPGRREVLLGEFDPGMFVEAARPGGDDPGKQVRHCQLGAYRLFWKSGGSSVASVGMTYDGTRWYAPANWTTGSADASLASIVSTDWGRVDRVELIEVNRSVGENDDD